MGFDYGRRRIGVAIGQTVSRTANALTVLERRSNKLPWDALGRLIREWSPDRFVLGCPQHADGSEHPLRNEIESFARKLRGRFNTPVELVDERLSSYAADSVSNPKADNLDAHAAKLILETWLESSTATERS